MTITLKHAGYAAVAGLLVGGIAYAATSTVTATATFAPALVLNKISDIDFGVLQAMTTGRYVITTAGVVTASNGGVPIGGATKAARITISGSTTQTIRIQAGNYAPDHGVTPSAATCEYNGTTIADCTIGQAGMIAPDVGGHTLNIGLQIDTDGTQTAGTVAIPTFEINVLYG